MSSTSTRPSAKGDKKKDKKKRRAKRRVNPRFTAQTADKYDLYQLSVQSPEEDVKFLARVFKKERGEEALHLREDFCGTALLCSHWIRRSEKHTAEGFDIDPEPVSWGLAHHFEEIGEQAKRMRFHLRDVREKSTKRPQMRVAHNFSYCVFKEREVLIEWLRSVYLDLAPDGIFSIDVHGGPEAMEEMEEETVIKKGLEYVWDQHEYWPATAEAKCYIHFRFGDGTSLERAFRYDWRLWSLTELKDALSEVGFPRVEVYWEGTDKDGESGNGIFRPTKRGENCASWIAYLIGIK
jgi:SAM-dependent methyltransferase